MIENQLKSADLEKRSKELSLREEQFSEKEKLLNIDQRIAEIKILDNKLKFKKQALKNIEATLAAATQKTKDNILSLDSLLAAKRLELKETQDFLDNLQENAEESLKLLKETNNKFKIENSELESTISQRKVYLEEQEAQIDTVIKEGNDRLFELKHAIDDAEGSKLQALEETTRLEQSRDILTDEILALQDKASKLSESYEEKADGYRFALSELSKTIDEREQQLSSLEQQLQGRIKSVDAREKSLIIQEKTYQDKYQELEYKERRLRSNYEIAGKPYN